GEIGHGPLGGSFEFFLEAAPLLFLHQPLHTFGVAASPLDMRWNFRPAAHGRVRLFAELSGGVVYTNQPIRATSFNFIDQAGFGVRVARPHRLQIVAGYRFQHISDAGLVEPNPGANFNFVYGGVT